MCILGLIFGIITIVSSDIINIILISHHICIIPVISEEATWASALSQWHHNDLSQRRDVSLEPLVDGGSVSWKGRREWRHEKKHHRQKLSSFLIFPYASICQPFLFLCFSVSHFLSHCVSVLGGAGQARSVWFRAVSRRRIGSIYSLVCSGPHWPEVSVCFSLRLPVGFCQSVIHLSHISWSPFYLILPTDTGLTISSSPSSTISWCLTSSASLLMLTHVSHHTQFSTSFHLFTWLYQPVLFIVLNNDSEKSFSSVDMWFVYLIILQSDSFFLWNVKNDDRC